MFSSTFLIAGAGKRKTHFAESLAAGNPVWTKMHRGMYSCKAWKREVRWMPLPSAVFAGKQVWRDMDTVTSLCIVVFGSSSVV